MDAELNPKTYGRALGELVLRKRRAKGLTQTQLAEDAYNTSGKTRRISELETGKVANPHPATIDPIIAILGITQEEIEDCARHDASRTYDDLDDAYRSARNLIEAVARQFEHARPEASLSELDEFLRAKAKEWRQLRDRLAAIEADDQEVQQLTAEAAEALAQGKFDDVERLLSSAEERHQETKTLKAVEQQAAIRIARGDAYLLREDPEQALAAYRIAARYFEPFDIESAIQTLHDLAHRAYESSLRSLKPRFVIAAQLLDDLAAMEFVKADAWRLAVVNYRRGIVYLNEAVRGPGEPNPTLLDQAVSFSRNAVAEAQGAERGFQAVCSRVALANALMERGKQSNKLEDIDEAMTSLRSARVIGEEVEEAKPLLAHVSNSLGAAILAKQKLEAEDDSGLIAAALVEFQRAAIESEKHLIVEVWGAAKMNVARMLRAQSKDDSTPDDERYFLQIRAIAEYLSAIETFPVTEFPDKFGEAHFELAGLLFEHAMALEGQMADLYMVRAMQHYEVATTAVFTRERDPARWAAIHMYVGTIFRHHADLETTSDKTFDFEQAHRCFTAAAEVFGELRTPENAGASQRALKRLLEEAEELGIALP